MAWALIRTADQVWLSGPHEAEPTPAAGEETLVIALGWPDTCEWSPSRGGFVDVVVARQTLTRLQFQRRFTIEERIAIRASTDPLVIDYRELCSVAEDIELTDADVVAGITYLEAEAVIASGRAAEILTV